MAPFARLVIEWDQANFAPPGARIRVRLFGATYPPQHIAFALQQSATGDESQTSRDAIGVGGIKWKPER